MSEKQTEVQQLALELDALSSAKKWYPSGVCAQMLGCESYVLKGTGFSFSCIDEAAQKLIDLEEANSELVKTLKYVYERVVMDNRDYKIVNEALEKHGGK